MKEKSYNIFKESYFFEWYYVIVIIGYIATLFISAMRPGVLAAALMIGALAELIFKKKMNIHNLMDVLIVVYFIYRLMTIICIINSNMPVGVYTGELAVSCLPMIFYFAGRAVQNRIDGFYKRFLSAFIGLGVVSLLLYVIGPQFYCNYLYNWSYISKADVPTMRVRMQSVVGSTLFGAMMIFALAAGIYFICKSEEKEKSGKARVFGVVSVFTGLIFAFLSSQRSAMVTGIVLLLYINFLIFIRFENIPRKYLLFEIILIVVFMLAVAVFKSEYIFKIWARLASLPGAISERSEQWVAAVNNMYSSWFGNGLGANGHKALGIDGAHVIADGGLIKLYCEEGVIGFTMFAYIVFMSLKRGVKSIMLFSAEIGIIIAALLLSIGSNVLCFQLATPIFWFAIGRIWEDGESEFPISIKSWKEKNV